ncbi:hypothetical protein D9757_007001 [Collybiopsis confluens]|uniref:UBA domain-containing protein n=1 Tax=Collybiopsis confluens TaxID=2823264 RepID=A0A8H5HBW0_9AGAR|nr:hypothetical protein D9757_007001 [Collybiopsis confluens]
MSDSFADLWDFSAAPKSADLTIAQKTAIAEQERIDALLKNQQQRQQQQQQQQQNSSSAWDGLDSLVQPEVHGSEPLLGDEDILGDLGRPVDELRKEQAQKQAVAQPPSPPPHILGQIVEMGFSLHQARAALASTSSGQDIQAALESLIAPRRPSPPSPDPERSPPMSHTPVPKQRQRTHQDLPSEGSGTSQTDNILSQASELGFNLFNRANAAWKEGKERVQKVYGERRAAMSEEGSDSSRRNSGRSTPTRPKWMLEEVPAVPAPKSSRKEIDLLSDSSAAPVYVSKFRHAKPKVSTPPHRPYLRPIQPPLSPLYPLPSLLLKTQSPLGLSFSNWATFLPPNPHTLAQ